MKITERWNSPKVAARVDIAFLNVFDMIDMDEGWMPIFPSNHT
jgi:hypothetical protein